jgi:hypothetical protein
LPDRGAQDLFLIKYDSSGNLFWAKGIGGAKTDHGIAIAVDTQGSVYMIGRFRSSTIHIDSYHFTNNHKEAFLLFKFDTNGNFL